MIPRRWPWLMAAAAAAADTPELEYKMILLRAATTMQQRLVDVREQQFGRGIKQKRVSALSHSNKVAI